MVAVAASCTENMVSSSTMKIDISGTDGGSSVPARPPSRSSASSWHCRLRDEDEDGTVSETSADSSTEGVGCDDVRSLFVKASSYLNPGRLFRSAVYLFGERKLFVFFMMHFACTMIIWFHFALTKFEQQKEAVPVGAPFYWLKRMAPTLEFGTMHAILFQMALLPLTMARYSISSLSGTVLDRFIPLKRTLRMHIHLGYTMILFVVLGTILFFGFFGTLCRRGDQAFCDKLTSEIMITGLVILGSLLVIVVTSYCRHWIPYEVFYVIHHLVFVMYLVTILHTFDVEQRKGNSQRSQTFKWFSSTVLFYVCDRVAMHLNHKYRTRLLSSSTVVSSNGSKMIILNLRRPALFRFKPGQYAYLKVSKIDSHWHPFSIASEPSSDVLQFKIEVFSSKSWSGRLWDFVEDDGLYDFSFRQVDVEVMGPIGTELAKTENYSHVLAIGTGTGIVPILSLFKEQVHQLLQLEPGAFFQSQRNHRRKIHAIEMAEEARRMTFAQGLSRIFYRRKTPYLQLQSSQSDKVKASVLKSIARCEAEEDQHSIHRRSFNRFRMKSEATATTRSIYHSVLLSLMPSTGVALIGLMISWNTINVSMYPSMVFFLKVFSVMFQACFTFVAIFRWDANVFLAYVDLAMIVLTPFADWYWFPICQVDSSLGVGALWLYSILTGYMVFRFWSKTVTPQHRSWKGCVDGNGCRTMERIDMVWVCRSASLVSEMLPEIDSVWQNLTKAWGVAHAENACRISIYVTDKNHHACSVLRREMTKLSLQGRVFFGRPRLGGIIREHTIGLVATRRYSNTLLAYVGSPQLAEIIHHYKISNDVVATITGNKNHQMEFVSESYGSEGSKKEKSMEGISVEDVSTQSGEIKSKSVGSGLPICRTRLYKSTKTEGDALSKSLS